MFDWTTYKTICFQKQKPLNGEKAASLKTFSINILFLNKEYAFDMMTISDPDITYSSSNPIITLKLKNKQTTRHTTTGMERG